MNAGSNTQATSAVAVGSSAGLTSQGSSAVAIGAGAGQINQGGNAVAIGLCAGYDGQASNSIVVNASGSILNNTVTGTCVVKPLRAVTGGLPPGFTPVSYTHLTLPTKRIV